MPHVIFSTTPMDGGLAEFRRLMLTNWPIGLTYMAGVIGILLLHEFGHFFAILIYKIPASYPIFLPMPFSPIGTFGAIIVGMRSDDPNRKQLFDIGIAGPIGGLILAIPLTFIGISQLDLTIVPRHGFGFHLPLAMHWLALWYEVPGYVPGEPVWINQLTPVFAAAWLGLIITGLNMMPISHLDGGHVTYCLFGKKSHWLARACLISAIAFMVYHWSLILLVMVVLILYVGTDHPETSDDSVKLGPVRWVIGLASLSIPILCFPPQLMELIE